MAKYKLGDIAPIQQGSVPESESYWLLNLDMVESNTGHIYERLYVPFDKIGTSTIAFDTNNVLYSKLRPYLNKVVIPDCPGYATSEMLPLKPNKNYITREYLTYFLRSPKFVAYINEKTSGAKMPRANSSDLKSVEIECPTLENQRHITSEFDRIISIVRLRQQQLQKLDELVKARFVEMFGDPVQNSLKWVTKSLLEMGYCKNGVNFHSGDSGIEIHCLGVGDFKDYSVVDGTDYLPTISLSEEPPEESMLQDGDIVFVRSNGNKALVGRCLVVYPHNTPTTYSGFCIRYRLTSDEVNTSYLLRVLKADSMRKKMIGRGANIQNLNQKTLATLNIPIPPMELQEQFAEFVNQTDKSKIAVQKALDEAQLLFDSLMQKYFG
ncbi:restriction endonuclease subunit S [Clostridium fessum]|uniref:restriction endonuclease subunit S n=1 Tax=Clostridium fessum TaxID=2126740 RepID=UPI003AF0642B